MWNINPRFMCRKHLLGEHVEMHMFIGTLRKAKKRHGKDAMARRRAVAGYIEKGLVELHNIEKRHAELVKEMKRRGFRHKSEITQEDMRFVWKEGKVDEMTNRVELARRCPECKKRMKETV